MSAPSPSLRPAPTVPWLVRIPLVFEGLAPELFEGMGVVADKKLGPDYHLIRIASPSVLSQPEAALLISWNLPAQHMWPCDPQKTRGFVEKAAQKLVEKFGGQRVQTILMGPLDPDPSQRYFRVLSANLRGRVLQVFPDLKEPADEAEAQDPEALTLYCLVGAEGLYAGVQSPRSCGGFHPGGTKFIKQGGPGFISRAGAKLAGALHFLLLHRPALPDGAHWLELGASPGGMTSELLARGYQVTAVDRAPLDDRLQGAPGLTFVRKDVRTFRPRSGVVFDAMLCDMNGPPEESIREVARLSSTLRPGGIVILTLKLPGDQSLAGIMESAEKAVSLADKAGLQRIAMTHLPYNRQEFTLFFERRTKTR